MTPPSRLSAEDWLQAGFRALVKAGPSALKAEPLARAMNTTKGSFYWHFQDVADFQNRMLAHWEKTAFRDVVSDLEVEQTPHRRLRRLGRIAAKTPGPEYGGAAIEPAIRAWARADAQVESSVRRIDDMRLDYLGSLLAACGLTAPEFARIIYAGLIGLEDMATRDGKDVQAPMETLIDLVLALE